MSKVHETTFIADGVRMSGNIIIEEKCGIWYNSTLRATHSKILIRKGSNVQDNCVFHADRGFEIELGENVSIGHSAIIHGCKIGDNTTVGMGAVIMNGASVGKNCLIGAMALVPAGVVIQDNSLVVGIPGKIRRQLTDKEIDTIRNNSLFYQDCAREEKSSPL